MKLNACVNENEVTRSSRTSNSDIGRCIMRSQRTELVAAIAAAAGVGDVSVRGEEGQVRGMWSLIRPKRGAVLFLWPLFSMAEAASSSRVSCLSLDKV